MVCKIFFCSKFPKTIEKGFYFSNARGFTFQASAKTALLLASMVVTYYIKLFQTGPIDIAVF